MHASSFIDNQTDEDYSFEVGETRSPFRALLHVGFVTHLKLVLDVDNVPMAVPFVHTRMQEMMPCRGANFPRIGKMKLPADKLPWNHLHKIFSLHDVELSEADLLNHYLLAFNHNNETSNEGVQLPKTEFIDDEIEYEDDDMNEDEMVDNFYDPVCAISDNGWSLAVKASS
ncbi:hypothetical protein ACFE04_010295 [Oxalis oulophora]